MSDGENVNKHQITSEQLAFAEENGLHVVRFVCDVRGVQTQRELFFVSLHHLPRPGDRVRLNDGRQGTVRKVLFNLQGEGDYQYSFPTVYMVVDDAQADDGSHH